MTDSPFAVLKAVVAALVAAGVTLVSEVRFALDSIGQEEREVLR